jgi:hypothetical protein
MDPMRVRRLAGPGCFYNYIRFDNIIIGGNLNITLSREEIWGSSAREDKLVNF